MSVHTPRNTNANERRPEAVMFGMIERLKTIDAAADYVGSVIKRTQPESLQPVIAAVSKVVANELAGNVISLAAKQVATAEAEQIKILTDQEQRVADALNAADAAHSEFDSGINYESAA